MVSIVQNRSHEPRADQGLMEGLVRHTCYPRLLVLDATRIGSLCATGQLKQRLFGGWASETLMQVYLLAGNCFGVNEMSDASRGQRVIQSRSAVLALCRNFQPDVIYYRPLDGSLHLHQLAVTLIAELGVPYIIHLMDDWPARLQYEGPRLFSELDGSLRRLLNNAAFALSIGTAMSRAFECRYGVPFTPIANCIEPADWTAFSARKSIKPLDGPMVIRYCGALADDMNFSSIQVVVHTIHELQEEMDIRLEIYTWGEWKQKALEAFGRFKGVAVRSAFDSDADYRRLLSESDVLLIAYNFDEPSMRYVRYSIANKLPECLASATPVLAFGPAEVATIAYCQDNNLAHLVTAQDTDRLKEAIRTLSASASYRYELGQRARAFAFEHLDARSVKSQFYEIIKRAAAVHGWSDTVTPSPADDPGLLSRFERRDHARFDEVGVIAKLLAGRGSDGVMIDVGAHAGSSLAPFLALGWTVYAFEPDPDNRARLQARFGSCDRLVVDGRAVSDAPADKVPFYTSKESTGISGLSAFNETHRQTCVVSTTSLSQVVCEHHIKRIDFLKIDVEGFDFMVLKGTPWDEIRPDVILCEFEDRKTTPLGYTSYDMIHYLESLGYVVFVSEWHAVLRYGIQHDWKRLVRYPCHLSAPNGWGNLIALKECPGDSEIRKAALKHLRTRGTAGRLSRAQFVEGKSLADRFSLKQASRFVRKHLAGELFASFLTRAFDALRTRGRKKRFPTVE